MGGGSSYAFVFYKHALIILNIIYLVVSLILIVAPAVAMGAAKFTSVPIVGGVIASGVFLLVVAIIGFVGAVKHHQVLLFFYIVTLGILFVILFSVSVAALAVNGNQRHALLQHTWRGFNDHDKAEVQYFFDCCGFDSETANLTSTSDGHPLCNQTNHGVDFPKCCNDTTGTLSTILTAPPTNSSPPINHVPNGECPLGDCDPCYDDWSDQVAKAFKVGGGVGLFFSLTELFGVIVTIYYRNKKDPTANPNAFL